MCCLSQVSGVCTEQRTSGALALTRHPFTSRLYDAGSVTKGKESWDLTEGNTRHSLNTAAIYC